MKLPTTDEAVKYIETKMRTATFKNKHGEKFVIHSDGSNVLMSGDEVNMMVSPGHKFADKYIPLFNSHFGIWSPQELYELGKALQRLHKDLK